MPTLEIRTNGRRFAVVDSGSCPGRPNDYRHSYTWPTLEDAEQVMVAVVRRYRRYGVEWDHVPLGTPPRFEPCVPVARARMSGPWMIQS